MLLLAILLSALTRSLFLYRFAINKTSGVITVQSGLDRESVAGYKLTIKAADLGTPSKSSSRDVIITVIDVNDNDPKFTADQYQGKIAEDASVGSPVVQVQCDILFSIRPPRGSHL